MGCGFRRGRECHNRRKLIEQPRRNKRVRRQRGRDWTGYWKAGLSCRFRRRRRCDYNGRNNGRTGRLINGNHNRRKLEHPLPHSLVSLHVGPTPSSQSWCRLCGSRRRWCGGLGRFGRVGRFCRWRFGRRAVQARSEIILGLSTRQQPNHDAEHEQAGRHLVGKRHMRRPPCDSGLPLQELPRHTSSHKGARGPLWSLDDASVLSLLLQGSAATLSQVGWKREYAQKKRNHSAGSPSHSVV